MERLSQARRIFRFGVFELDPQSGELRRRGLKIRLPAQPCQVLVLLLERAGELVTREELRQRLWPAETTVDFDTGLNGTIRRLRAALRDSADKPCYVETLPRHGYRFIGGVEGPGLAPIQSLAVLPLENFTGDPGQEYFVDGVTDALINELARISRLRIISRTSVMRYRGVKKPLPEIARELKVDAVVEGAVMRSGERVRITAQLIHAPADRQLWARSYERDLGDILALQREVAGAIAEEVEVKLEEGIRRARPRPVSPAAYDLYLRGRYHLNEHTAAGCEKARRCFEQAIAEEPRFALAHAGLSTCHSLRTFLGAWSPQECMPKAEAAGRTALEMDGTLAEAHLTLALVAYRFRHDWRESEKEFRRALELNPSDAECHRAYSIFLWSAGRLEEALAEAQRAREFDPLSPNGTEGWTFLWARQYDQAIAEFRRAADTDPAFAHARLGLGSAYALRGDFPEAIRELKLAVKLSRRTPTYLARLGHAYAAAGKTRDARRILEELLTRSRLQYVSPVGIALVHLGLGDKEAALTRLEEAYRVRDFDLVTRNPRLAPLRSNPRFQDLMRRVGLAR